MKIEIWKLTNPCPVRLEPGLLEPQDRQAGLFISDHRERARKKFAPSLGQAWFTGGGSLGLQGRGVRWVQGGIRRRVGPYGLRTVIPDLKTKRRARTKRTVARIRLPGRGRRASRDFVKEGSDPETRDHRVVGNTNIVGRSVIRKIFPLCFLSQTVRPSRVKAAKSWNYGAVRGCLPTRRLRKRWERSTVVPIPIAVSDTPKIKRMVPSRGVFDMLDFFCLPICHVKVMRDHPRPRLELPPQVRS